MSDFNVVADEEYDIIRRHRKEKQHEEYKYLHLLQNIMENGFVKRDRTGTGTIGIVGNMMKFNIRNQFILLTTKKVHLRGIFEELKLFLSGNTNTKILEEKGVNIWKGNTNRKFLNSRGLDFLPEGDLGCSYSHTWRNFGGEHPLIPETKGCKGIDQISRIIDRLKTNPLDRRIILTGISPQQEHLMSLPCCHNYTQWLVNPNTNELNVYISLRSNDTFLGCPYNLAQYNLLTLFLCKMLGFNLGEMVYVGVDQHIYLNHIDQCKEQISRTPYPFPKLNIKKDIKTLEDIENLQYEDLDLVDYKCHPAIKAPMAV